MLFVLFSQRAADQVFSLFARPIDTLFLKDFLHRRKMSDWPSRDHVTLQNSKWRQYLHSLFIPVERRLIAA